MAASKDRARTNSMSPADAGRRGIAAGRMRLQDVLWLAWLGLLVCMFGSYFRWEVDYFRSPGPVFHTALVCLLPLYVAGCPVYLHWRRKRWWRYEIPAFVFFALACLLFYQPLASLVSALVFLSCTSTGLRMARAVRLPLQSDFEKLGL